MGWYCHKCEEFHEGACPRTGVSPGGQTMVGSPGDFILRCPLCGALHAIPPAKFQAQVTAMAEDMIAESGPLRVLVILPLCKLCQATCEGNMALAWSVEAVLNALEGFSRPQNPGL